MNIAQVVAAFPPHPGGMGTVSYYESLLLTQRGHEVSVFTLSYPDEHVLWYPFTVQRLKPFVRWGDAGLVPHLAAKLRGFDVAHLHYPFYGGAEWILAANVPFVLTYHMDAQTRGLKGLVQKAYDVFIPRRLFRQAKKVIAVDKDHFLKSDFGQDIDPGKVVEMYNGVDTDIFKPHAVEADALDLHVLHGKRVVLFVGNPLQLKRLDILIQAIKELNDPTVVLLVVGGGYELNRYKELAVRLMVDNRVYFIGRCDDPKRLSDYYNLADCLVVPSDYESFSLVITEAMACGVPVIGTDIPGIRNRVTSGIDGFLFTRRSVGELVAVLKKILVMPTEERKAMGLKGREKVLREYTWEKHIQELERVYREAVLHSQ